LYSFGRHGWVVSIAECSFRPGRTLGQRCRAELAQIRREGGDGREVARVFLENGDTTAAVQPLVHLHSRVEEVGSPSVEEFVQLVRREFERAEALTESQRVAGDVLIAVALLPEILAVQRKVAQHLVVLGALAQLAFGGAGRGDEDVQEMLSESMAVLPVELFPALVGGDLLATRDADGHGQVVRAVGQLAGAGRCRRSVALKSPQPPRRRVLTPATMSSTARSRWTN
jgi:hypothetical protein